MTPGPLRPEDLPARITRLYFGVVVPMVAVAVLSTLLGADSSRTAPTLAFAGLLLLTALVYGRVPPRWSWRLRPLFMGAQVLFVLLLALFGDRLGVSADGPRTIHLLLLLIPVNVLAWSLLFFDRPWLGRLLSLSLSLAAALLVFRLAEVGVESELGTAPLLLAVCLLTQVFGSAVVNLQRRVLLGEQQLRRDPLTGLLNRRAFEEASEAPALPGILAVIDVDHFKQVNDRHGHEAGDRVLRAVADVVLRTVAGSGQVYRWGGEEFIVTLPGDHGASGPDLLERVRREVAGRAYSGGQHVTVSIGMSRCGPGLSLREAFSQADAAMLAAKTGGRDRIVSAPAA